MPTDQWRTGVLGAAWPLAVAGALVGASMIALAVIRTVTASMGFATEQAIALATLAVAGVIVAAGYGMACRRVLARIRAWQLAEQRPAAAAATVTLCVTAVIVLLPVLLATLLPQHPAP